MSCELSIGFGLPCKNGLGGVKAFYVGDQTDFVAGITFNVNEEIDALPTATLFKITQKNTGVFTEGVNTENGNLFFLQTVTMDLKKLSAVKRKELKALAGSRNIVIFVQDANDNIWMCGRQRGMEMTVRDATTGTAAADNNGYTVTFTAEEPSAAERLESFTASPFDNFDGITIGTQTNN